MSFEFVYLRMGAVARTLLVLAMLMVLGVSGGGCAGTGSVLIAGVPGDLSFELVVLPSPGITSEVVGSLQLPVQRAHYVVHPNGRLQARRGRGAATNVYPKLVRQLSSSELLPLWQQVQRIRFATSAARSLGNIELAEVPTEGVSYVLWVRSHGEERRGRLDSGSAKRSAPELLEMVKLIAELERLSWGR